MIPTGRVALSLAAALCLGAQAPTAAPTSKGAPATEEVLRLNNLGIAYLAQFKPAEAEKLFREAVALSPDYAVGHTNIGIAALAQVHYEDAIAAFLKAIALDPANIHAHFNLSLIYKNQGRAAEALEEAQKALKADPRDPDIRYHVGSLHLTMRDFDRAIPEFEAVLRLDPNFLSAYYSLGRAWITKGDAEKGRKYIEKHRELAAGTGATPAVGQKYGEQGRYSYAMEDTAGSGPVAALQKGTILFKDVTAESGVAFVHHGPGRGVEPLRRSPGGEGGAALKAAAAALGSGVAVADVNGDGREDLFFTDSGAPQASPALYLNRGGFAFERAAAGGTPAVDGPAMSAAFGDLDGDADPDLVVARLDRLVVLLNDGKGAFLDRTAGSGLEGAVAKGLLGGVSLADVDHDGDLDLFAAGFLSPGSHGARAPFPAGWGGVENLLFVNATPPPAANAPAAQGPVVFVESAARARVGGGGRRSTGAIFADFDNDRDIDFALASLSGGTTLFSNLRDGTFGDLQAGSGLPSSAPILALAAGDYNKDGWMDLAASTWEGGLPRLFRNMGGEPSGRPGSSPGAGQFAADVPALAAVSRQIASPQFGLVFLDFDNDGYLDLAAVNGGDLGPAVFLLRNEGEGRFADATALTGLDGVTARGGRGLAAADLDQDGDLDLVVSNNGGRPTLLRNDGGSRSHWLRVAPAGRHSNRPGVGAKVEVKSGRLWQKAEITAGSGYLSQSPPVAHFGLGSRERVDTVRVLWPGGVLQDEVQVTADAVFAVQELDRKGSSCPILYAWNGAAFEFVSDFLGGSAIGYRTGPESFNVPDTDEYVLIPGDRLSARDGRLLIRMVNQLEETIYFDRARLLAVDHPAAIEIFPDEKLMPGPPFPGFRVFSVAESRSVIAARDGSGRDLLQALERVDRVYAEPPPMPGSRAFKGYAPEHEVTLDLGPLEPGAPVLLLLHGWIDYADSTSNLAASQAGLTLVPPYLEAYEASTGSWKRVVPRMGFPAGLPKTMTVDLTDALPPGSRLVRIRTSMRIYWDRIRVATTYGSAPSMTAMEAASADLRYRGFPALVTPDGRAPEVYDYSRDQEPIHWKSHVGHFTRYGDVRDLLAAVDDRYVITRPGDEIALEFPSEGLPPLPPGWLRDYLLFADGFGKDMDMNSARPHTVAPLPYHAMTSYPHAGRDGYPFMTEGIMEYIDAYNTRLVPAVMAPIGPVRHDSP